MPISQVIDKAKKASNLRWLNYTMLLAAWAFSARISTNPHPHLVFKSENKKAPRENSRGALLAGATSVTS
jgi:hypothetical protein